MDGTMLWFNVEKGFGFISTEAGERLYVARTGFLPNHVPDERCKGQPVRFERRVEDGEARAVDVSFPPEVAPRRARMRHARGASSR